MESHISAHIPGALAWSLAALALYAISCVIYNLYFSPLRHYPGPLLYRASRWPRNIRIMLGKWPQDLLALTEQYGPVIRVAPTMVIYTGADTWKEIMGNQNGAADKGAEFGKELYFYRSKGTGANILNESRENHSLLRRQLSHGLSDKSLREQEPIIMGYVDIFMAGLRERCGDRADPTRAGVDMRHWFNFATFDIIADLAFGEPFGCLEKGETAPQVAFIEKGLATAVPAYITKELGMEGFMKKLALNSGVVGFRKVMIEKTSAVLQRRMSLKFERPDLIEGLIRKKEDWNMDFETLRANASLLIIAGAETTATLLAGGLYLLLKNPDAFQKLKDEIRSAFKTENEITFANLENLPYLLAFFKEALRSYPPLPGETPRIVPAGGATVAGRFVPEGTTVSPAHYAMYHSSANFSSPFDFKPERFLTPEAYPEDNFDVLQPFNYGPRNCGGKNLAYAEMRAIMARLVWGFDMELVDEGEDWIDQKCFFLWHAKPPLNVRLTPVERS